MSFIPELSVVATSRNDNHGANLLARMQLFIDGFAEQAGRYRLPVELIVVEWNPLPDRPPLSEALQWRPGEMFQAQVTTVPADVHQALPNSARLPMYQMIAKNAGIRRARGPYVLATNIDILLSDELFDYLKAGLKPNTMYRVDRLDVVAPLEAPVLPSPASVRAIRPIREHGMAGMRYPNDAPAALPRRTWRDLARIPMAALDRLVLPRLHTSGCGDFTLTSREVWESLRGYPEWPIFSWHIDGVVLYQAYAAGVAMVNLAPPMVALHLEHSQGSGWTPEGSSALFHRLDQAGIPYLSTAEYRKLARKLVREGRRSLPINRPDWGLARRELVTTHPSGRVTR